MDWKLIIKIAIVGLSISSLSFGMKKATVYDAVRTGDIQKIESLLESGEDINQPEGINGWAPLYSACFGNEVAVVEMLIEKGAVVNKGTHNGFTPLHAASTCGYFNIVICSDRLKYAYKP